MRARTTLSAQQPPIQVKHSCLALNPSASRCSRRCRYAAPRATELCLPRRVLTFLRAACIAQRTITRIFPPSMTVYKPLVLQRIRHVLFAKKNAENVRGRAELCASIVGQVMEHGSHHAPGNALVLSGRPGIGKTAVMSDVIGQLTERLQKEFDNSPAGVSMRKKLDDSRKKRQAKQRKEEKKRRKESSVEAITKGAAGIGTSAGAAGLPNAGISVREREPRTVVPGRALIAHLVGSTTRSDDVRLLLTRLVLELREVLVQTAVLKTASNSRGAKPVQSLPASALAESPEACVQPTLPVSQCRPVFSHTCVVMMLAVHAACGWQARTLRQQHCLTSRTSF